MTHHPEGEGAAPGTEELRRRIERSREELGRTVQALAVKTDVKAQAREKAAEVKAHAAGIGEQAAAKAALATGRLRAKAAHAARSGGHGSPRAVARRAAALARTPRLAVPLGAGALVVALLLLRRGGKRR